MDCSISGFSILYYLFKLAQTHVLRGHDAIQTPHPLSPFSSCPQSLPASGSFPMTELFISGGQSIGALTSVSVLSMNIQGGFPLGSTGLIYCCPRDSQESSPTPQFKSISSLQHSAFFMVQLSHLCMTTGKTIAWTI